MNNVVIVESPAKAKTIEKYLGSGYTVLASYGHIRDLPSKDGSVLPDEDFGMKWEIDAGSKKRVSDISSALKNADTLFLATDPDREGEAIAWHIREVLEEKNKLKGVDVQRVVFNEITKSAIVEAFEHPRELDQELVDAYLARRALDYLVGFTLSPILWRKLPGSRSAGRVQSVALRLICDRETEIEAFNAVEYWSVKADFKTPGGKLVTANLTHINGEKLNKMSITGEAEAQAAAKAIEERDFSVGEVKRKEARRNPAAPFTTSTLQQEAARKLYFGAKKTMQVAQKLYEGYNIGGETVGLITYMRTDGVSIAGEAINECRSLIKSEYGANYVPAEPRSYKSKAKNAQEAHEAIRPTGMDRKPSDMAPYLSADELKLYTLIWRRTVASQMASAILDQVAVDITSPDGQVTLRATGSVIAFDGFYRLYQEGLDDSGSKEGEDDKILPKMSEADAMAKSGVTPDQHFTQPPPRYSEASLVKKLEELGIGRPSTYASIISVLQDRNYVTVDQRRFMPEDRGRFVTAFLSSFFERYVDFNFTAELENKLDAVSAGQIEWKQVLNEFWDPFSDRSSEVLKLSGTEIIDDLNNVLGPHFFRPAAGEAVGEGEDPRKCPVCDDGKLFIKPGRHGSFIGCSGYPECKFTTPLRIIEGKIDKADVADNGPKEIGADPATGLMITLRKGPYGYYVQLGEEGDVKPAKGKKAKKPKRGSLPRNMDPIALDLDKATALLSLPREVGIHPETSEAITASIGPFGPYLKYQGNFISLKEDDVLEIGINRAVTIIADAPKKEPVITLGDHPKDGKPVTIKTGRWGPFVQHLKARANLPKDVDKKDITLEVGLALLEAKNGKPAKAPAKKAAAKKPAAKKKAAPKKKAPVKKPVAKKPAAKKPAAKKTTAKTKTDS